MFDNNNATAMSLAGSTDSVINVEISVQRNSLLYILTCCAADVVVVVVLKPDGDDKTTDK